MDASRVNTDNTAHARKASACLVRGSLRKPGATSHIDTHTVLT